jgi:hypothetical protein
MIAILIASLSFFLAVNFLANYSKICANLKLIREDLWKLCRFIITYAIIWWVYVFLLFREWVVRKNKI